MTDLSSLTLRDIAKALRHRWPEAHSIELEIDKDGNWTVDAIVPANDGLGSRWSEFARGTTR